MKKTIAIFGCGWLGLPLAKVFVAEGHPINGSTTSSEKIPILVENGISPFLVDLTSENFSESLHKFLGQADILIINIPPRMKSRGTSSYLDRMEVLAKQLQQSTVTKVIFISSTSVYGSFNGEVTEKTAAEPVTEGAKQLLEAESLFLNDSTLQSTVIRFGGLIGDDRHPVHHLVKKDVVANGNHPVNLIQRTDCIAIIKYIIAKSYWGEIFNAVYPNHPSKASYYTAIAKERGLKPPKFSSNKKEVGKTIKADNLIHRKLYQFKTPI